jgi:hypothetical protein
MRSFCSYGLLDSSRCRYITAADYKKAGRKFELREHGEYNEQREFEEQTERVKGKVEREQMKGRVWKSRGKAGEQQRAENRGRNVLR